jgi:phenylalanyl-tRNA synthetase alpha chain
MTLIEELEYLIPRFRQELDRAFSPQSLESVRVSFLGRKGRLAGIMERLPSLPVEERAAVGRKANEVKALLNALMEGRKADFEKLKEAERLSAFDPTLPGRLPRRGSRHPATLVIDEVCGIFRNLGYDIVSGPEVETDYYNFEALNMPPEHPARDMQDTLYVSGGTVMRTHTSPVQVRAMRERRPPLAVIAPGKVYRRDSDLTHTPMFHQVEGLCVGSGISMAHLRGTLTVFLRGVFGAETGVRFRPSFFPFTEPSAEADISCRLCDGSGRAGTESCRVCKGTGWVEILGCGMVDPAVFESVGYDPERVTGFAFGLGVERIAMLQYGIGDLRMFFENDARFLAQF